MITIETLGPEAAARHVPGLAAVLTDCVTKGASVSFMNPYSQADGEAYFRKVAASVAAGDTVLVAAFLGDRIIGTAQLGLDMPPNQPHRAEVKKMLVHSDGRRQGIAGSLLRRVEEEALARGRTLLILDTGSEEARRVYERGGWSRFGFVPDFALWPDGGFCDTTFYLKDLTPPRNAPPSGAMVRDATEDDLPAILEIINDAIVASTAVWSDEPVDLDERRAWLAERRAAGNPVLVAEDDGASSVSAPTSSSAPGRATATPWSTRSTCRRGAWPRHRPRPGRGADRAREGRRQACHRRRRRGQQHALAEAPPPRRLHRGRPDAGDRREVRPPPRPRLPAEAARLRPQPS